MRKRAVRFRHAVHILLLLDRRTFIFGSCNQFLGELDRLALLRNAIAKAPRLHHSGMQIEIMRHYRRADNANREVQHIGISEDVCGRRKAADYRTPLRIGKRNLDRALELWRAERSDCDVTVRWRPFFLNPDTPESGEPYRPFLDK